MLPHHAGQVSLFWIQAVNPVTLQTVKRKRQRLDSRKRKPVGRLDGVQGEQGRHMPWHICLRKSLEVLGDVENKKPGTPL